MWTGPPPTAGSSCRGCVVSSGGDFGDGVGVGTARAIGGGVCSRAGGCCSSPFAGIVVLVPSRLCVASRLTRRRGSWRCCDGAEDVVVAARSLVVGVAASAPGRGFDGLCVDTAGSGDGRLTGLVRLSAAEPGCPGLPGPLSASTIPTSVSEEDGHDVTGLLCIGAVGGGIEAGASTTPASASGGSRARAAPSCAGGCGAGSFSSSDDRRLMKM